MFLATGSANGKVIIFGEYAVFYGVTGYAVALKDFMLTLSVEVPEIYTSESSQFDISKLLQTCKVISNIPQGSGLGSSAALSVAISRALSYKNSNFNIFDTAKTFDDKFHDGSSGIDTFTICHGGFCQLRNGCNFEKLSTLFLHKLRTLKFSILDTGQTRMVKEIKSKLIKKDFDEYLTEASEISKDFTKILFSESSMHLSLESISSLFNRSQRALVKLKVSTNLIDNITNHLISIFPSIGIKITGGGGGGCLLLVHNESLPELALKQALIDFISIKLYYDVQFSE